MSNVTEIFSSMVFDDATMEARLPKDTYKEAVRKIDKAVARGILHKNNAARKKSRFTKMLNKA